MLHNTLPLIPQTVEIFNSSNDLQSLILRLLVHFAFLTIVIRFLYYQKTKRKDYLFTYYLIGIVTFFLCFGLKKLDIDIGLGLGLFAIFGIIRYRTDAIEIKEMTYLFMVIGMSVVNSLSSEMMTYAELGVINGTLLVLTFVLEYVWLMRHETRKTINYERIDLILPDRSEEMKADLEMRTGLKINRVEVGKIDFLNDTAQVRIYYYADDQQFSDYSAQ
jgi:hypothetical protein